MIEVDIVTPHKQFIRGAQVNALKLPAAKGEIMVLPGHTEMITLLGTGILSFAQDGAEKKFAISYGYAEISNDRVLVMAETCELANQIDLERAQKAQNRAEAALSGLLTREEFVKYERKLQRALIRQKANVRSQA